MHLDTLDLMLKSLKYISRLRFNSFSCASILMLVAFLFACPCSLRKWKTALKSTSPLILLGFGRLVFTAGVDYQVEYISSVFLRLIIYFSDGSLTLN